MPVDQFRRTREQSSRVLKSGPQAVPSGVKTFARLVAAAAVGAVVAVTLAACGTGGISKGAANEERGKTLFAQKCAGCHGLAAAGSVGGIGPNLDDSFAQARAEGFAESAIRNIVHEQIKYPGQYPTGADNPSRLKANMPANLVKGQDSDDVSAYVAANAGVDGFAEAQAVTGTNGKEIFIKKCGGCHTLTDAGTSGTTGPNLDLLKPSFPVTQRQVTNGGGLMPAFKATLTKAQIDAVSRYVAQVAGKK